MHFTTISTGVTPGYKETDESNSMCRTGVLDENSILSFFLAKVFDDASLVASVKH